MQGEAHDTQHNDGPTSGAERQSVEGQSVDGPGADGQGADRHGADGQGGEENANGLIDLSAQAPRQRRSDSAHPQAGTAKPGSGSVNTDRTERTDPDGTDSDGTGSDGTDVGTRDRIVQAAAEVFLQKGFTGTRVVDIARRAGFTSGALYSYFDSRAELLAEAVARGSSQMLSRLLGAQDADQSEDRTHSSGQDAIAVLQSALDQIASPIDESDQMLLDGIALAHREPVAGDRLALAVEEFRSQLAHADEGALGGDAADMLVVLVLGITAARALGWHDPPSQQMREHIADCLVQASRATTA